MDKVKVFIIDDSAVVRQTLEKVFQSDSQIEVVGSAVDPISAAEKLRTVVPDVITLDVEMPRMDGITFLQKLMSQHPIPVVMCSSLTGEGSNTALKALEYGAVEIITKPKLGAKEFFEESAMQICDVIKAAAKSNVKKISETIKIEKKLTAAAVLQIPKSNAMIQTTEKVVVVGASTGGTEALKVFLKKFPIDCPGIVVVQHMPENFTRSFANRLNEVCTINVKEAENGDAVIRGRALIARGNYHLLLKRSGAKYYVEAKQGPLVSRHRPSVDVLFRSAARYAGRNAIGVILTGMGDDGAKGMLEMKEAGAYNFGQDERSSVVYGMPKEAFKNGAVDKQYSLEDISAAVLKAAYR